MASFFTELKRRNVVKVAVAYGIVAWLLIEVSSVLGPALHLPSWATTLVAFFLILGFICVLQFKGRQASPGRGRGRQRAFTYRNGQRIGNTGSFFQEK